MEKPDFTKEQLNYLAEILAIRPCHDDHPDDGCESDHHLDGYTCSLQRSEAWTHAMINLGFDPENPERRLHNDCPFCLGSKHDLHGTWRLGVLLTSDQFNDPKQIHREVWHLFEIPRMKEPGQMVARANLKQFLRARGYPKPEDCPLTTSFRGRCQIAQAVCNDE